MITLRCGWCGCFMPEEEAHEVAIYDEETDELTGYDIACDLCDEYLATTIKALKD